MSVKVTDKARENLVQVMKDSDFSIPALRVVFSGFG